MYKIPNIGQLFTPLQPATEKMINGIFYSMVKPLPLLQKYIYSYWEFYTEKPLTTPYLHRVVADGCIALIVDLKNPENTFIRGFVTNYTAYEFAGSFHYAGVCFYPGAFPLLFKLPAEEITNRFEQLNPFMPGCAKHMMQAFDRKVDIQIVKQVFDKYFLEILYKSSSAYDGRFFNAIDLILKSHGTLNVQSELNTGVSPRQLRRLFEFYIGDTPKTFCNIVRFQHLINSRPTPACIRNKKIFYEAGYYDQAHFIKEFKKLYGLTPSLALQ